MLPKLRPVSRYQLVLAILMFIGSPAWIGVLVLATIALATSNDPAMIMRGDAGGALLIWVLVMWFSPKIAGALDVLLSPQELHAFGGAGRFAFNFAIETVYSILLVPILWISHTIFLFGLLFNREIHWMGQVRDDHAVPLTLALQDLWPDARRLASYGQTSHGRCHTFCCSPADRLCQSRSQWLPRGPRSANWRPASASAESLRKRSSPRTCSNWLCPRSSQRAGRL